MALKEQAGSFFLYAVAFGAGILATLEYQDFNKVKMPTPDESQRFIEIFNEGTDNEYRMQYEIRSDWIPKEGGNVILEKREYISFNGGKIYTPKAVAGVIEEDKEVNDGRKIELGQGQGVAGGLPNQSQTNVNVYAVPQGGGYSPQGQISANPDNPQDRYEAYEPDYRAFKFDLKMGETHPKVADLRAVMVYLEFLPEGSRGAVYDKALVDAVREWKMYNKDSISSYGEYLESGASFLEADREWMNDLLKDHGVVMAGGELTI